MKFTTQDVKERTHIIYTLNGMVHLPQEWNFATPKILPSPATLPSPLTATHEVIFLVINMWHHRFNILTLVCTSCFFGVHSLVIKPTQWVVACLKWPATLLWSSVNHELRFFKKLTVYTQAFLLETFWIMCQNMKSHSHVLTNIELTKIFNLHLFLCGSLGIILSNKALGTQKCAKYTISNQTVAYQSNIKYTVCACRDQTDCILFVCKTQFMTHLNSIPGFPKVGYFFF